MNSIFYAWLDWFACLLQLILNKVLLVGSSRQTMIGRPIVPDAAVHAVVEEHVSVPTFLFHIPHVSVSRY